MTRAPSILGWLEDKSDWLSPLVVKEVRQLVRGREFMVSFGASLAAGLAVAFFGAVDALGGSSSSGNWTFASLMACLAFLGLAVVPLGAFSALRTERMEQTLELITLTSLSSRRIVVGKLLAQAVKLGTLFAAMAPFVTMSFLLGGVDFVTILIALVVLFMLSVWAGALCLLLSTAFKSRAMSFLVFGAVGVLGLFGASMGRMLFFAARGGALGPVVFGVGIGSTTTLWWVLAIVTTFWLISLINLVLLAENRMSLSTEDSVTPLRIGFLVQFLVICGYTMAYVFDPPLAKSRAAEALLVLGSGHLAIVAVFVVSEDLAVPRRVLFRIRSASPWRWLMAMFGPGGGRGAAYVLVQMVLLFGAVTLLQLTPADRRMLLAVFGYVLFFTGIPALAFRRLMPARATPLRIRAAVLVTLAVAMLVPDILYYIVQRPETLDLDFAMRHLFSPIRTIDSWDFVERANWVGIPFAIGLTGLLAYVALIRRGVQATGKAVLIDRAAPVAGETGRGGVVY